ncbi:MAG: BolA family transcriptional regulator [Alphaproteobacteria bacterium]|nr:BolA family transcriptional regulator [Alphaproteobacteria bacterium]MBP7759647.1 BolA family transcriptional regulator [Alphaproteobacteria bacterium]MBP7762997.1 BolA family transcriptional regulator [Alphaproteobacteria bacterium]MBP7904444.1 BolA family transcriptional regulator [Alphaproteobacteria bacterium]
MGMEQRMAELLRSALEPEELEIINESHLHRGHSGDDGTGESHYKLIIVSNRFQGLSRLQRHRWVTQILGSDVEKIHALSLKLLTPAEKNQPDT